MLSEKNLRIRTQYGMSCKGVFAVRNDGCFLFYFVYATDIKACWRNGMIRGLSAFYNLPSLELKPLHN